MQGSKKKGRKGRKRKSKSVGGAAGAEAENKRSRLASNQSTDWTTTDSSASGSYFAHLCPMSLTSGGMQMASSSSTGSSADAETYTQMMGRLPILTVKEELPDEDLLQFMDHLEQRRELDMVETVLQGADMRTDEDEKYQKPSPNLVMQPIVPANEDDLDEIPSLSTLKDPAVSTTEDESPEREQSPFVSVKPFPAKNDDEILDQNLPVQKHPELNSDRCEAAVVVTNETDRTTTKERDSETDRTATKERDNDSIVEVLEPEVAQLHVTPTGFWRGLNYNAKWESVARLKAPPTTTFLTLRQEVQRGFLRRIMPILTIQAEQRRFGLNDSFRGKTALIEVCERACTEAHTLDTILVELVKRGARVDVADATMRLPIHVAASRGNFCLLKTLLLLRSPVNTVDRQGLTPLDYVLRAGNPNEAACSALRALLSHGAVLRSTFPASPRFFSLLVTHSRVMDKLFTSCQRVLIHCCVKLKLTPVMARSMSDVDTDSCAVEYSFGLQKRPVPNERYCYFVMLAVCSAGTPRTFRMRMWGENPVVDVSLNGTTLRSLQGAEYGFVFICDVLNGQNILRVTLDSSTLAKKQLLMAQMVLVELEPDPEEPSVWFSAGWQDKSSLKRLY